MRKADVLRRKVVDIELRPGASVGDLLASFDGAGGFTAKKVATGARIVREMIRERACTVFLSFPAALVATGVRGVLRALVERKMVDVVVTTCGTVDHDLARAWGAYYHGEFELDDAALRKVGVHRLGNVLVPKESYGPLLERRVQPILRELWREGVRAISTRDLLWEIGKRVKDRKSILYWAWKNKIPMFIPAIFDGAFGSQLWSFWQDHRQFRIDEMADEQALADIVFTAKRTGALVIGGGVSKHHTIWWNQFRDGLDYAVYVTTAPEWDGSLSGARVREAVSWNKVQENARQVTIEGDASVILPLLVAPLIKK
ncbi:MAG: deoxyhypusine synthase [Methanobacteriota archaeon]|nr:MAG: deoxyhypusine synthase [Euryarchaeota archaeon]